MSPTAKLTKQALRLTPTERARLAHTLIASLDEPADLDAEEAWAKEIERRVKEIRSGKAVGRPVDEALADIRAKLKSK
jgi:putative addiction module component (TIGR02574 family)